MRVPCGLLRFGSDASISFTTEILSRCASFSFLFRGVQRGYFSFLQIQCWEELATAGAGGSPPKSCRNPTATTPSTSTQWEGFAGFTDVLSGRLWEKWE